MSNEELKTVLDEINTKLDELLELLRDSGDTMALFQ